MSFFCLMQKRSFLIFFDNILSKMLFTRHLMKNEFNFSIQNVLQNLLPGIKLNFRIPSIEHCTRIKRIGNVF